MKKSIDRKQEKRRSKELSIYEIYGSKNKEELFDKVMRKEKEVQDLIDFIEYSKCRIEHRFSAINSPLQLFDFIKSTAPPKEKQSYILFTNKKCHPLSLYQVSLDDPDQRKDVIRKGLMSGATNTFLFFHEKDDGTKHLEECNDLLSHLRLTTIDSMRYEEKTTCYISQKSEQKYVLADPSESLKKPFVFEDKKKIESFEGTNEFLHYYAQRMVAGKDIVDHNSYLQEMLKVGFQYEIQEKAGLLLYDKENKVQDLKLYSLGGIDRAIVDMRVIFKEALKADCKGMILFHNHPSGVSEPSEEDFMMSDQVLKISKMIGVEVADHLVIAKESVTSMKDFEFRMQESFSNPERINISEIDSKKAVQEFQKELSYQEPKIEDFLQGSQDITQWKL